MAHTLQRQAHSACLPAVVAEQLQLDGKTLSLDKFNGMFDRWQLTRADSLDAGELSDQERTRAQP